MKLFLLGATAHAMITIFAALLESAYGSAKSAHGASQAETVNDGEIRHDLKPLALRELLERRFLGGE